MIKENDLDKFRYFLECYFNVSCDYSELDSIIKEYKEFENKEYILKLKQEVKLILSNKDLEFAQNFIKKYGMRTMTSEKIVWFMNEIINKV